MRLKNLCYSSWNLFLSDALVLKLLKLRFFLLWHTTALFFQHESHSCQLGDRQNTLFGSLEVSHPFSIQVSTKSSDSISKENGVRSDFQSLTISKNLNSILSRVDCIYSIQVLVTIVSRCSITVLNSLTSSSILMMAFPPRENLVSLLITTSYFRPSTTSLMCCFWGDFFVRTTTLGLVVRSANTTCSQSFRG